MSRGLAVAVALVVATAAALSACGGPDAGQQWRVVAASGLALERTPEADDRELRVRFVVNALTATPDPVDHVEVTREDGQLGIRVWLRERIPAADEHVPNYAGHHSATVPLDEPVGQATVVDLGARPPTPVPTRA